MKKINFDFFFRRNGQPYRSSAVGIIDSIFGVPVYIPAGTAKNLHRYEKLVARATQLAKDLKAALTELSELEAFNNRLLTDSAKVVRSGEEIDPTNSEI